nr:retrovirus-related Pol polyprotein from transposon TNT 1-94 [Tanacetum cinerariifolium]
MNGNLSYLSDFKEFNRGYVTFRGGANGGRITGKGLLKLICDKKNNVLFTNTGCFVLSPDFKLTDESQNRALVVKAHKKTLYELFRGRTPALSFMRPFGCHFTILNTLDHLGKFDGKVYEGYFVGYSMNSKAFKVYNIRTRRVEENLHIEFLENKHIVVGAGPKWLFDINMLTESMNNVPVIACTNSDDFANKESGALNELNSAFENLNTEYPDDPNMPGLETIAPNDDSEEEVDFTYLESSIQVSPTPTTRIHKD